MPELPDIAIYIEALEARVLGQDIRDIRVRSPFLVRTVTPPLAEAKGRKVVELRRIGKRIAVGLDGDLWLVFHLMIAGRLHWRAAAAQLANRNALLALDFNDGTLILTEAGSKRRASLHVIAGQEALAALDPGGLEVLDCDLDVFAARLTSANHTLKRALTDPKLFSGIGNAYSDEILHKARLSPVAMTHSLSPEDIERLFAATQSVLRDWIARLRSKAGDKFPEKVTSFQKGMAMHGRFGEPCPDCGAPVQRIRYADNETNYCARCQTGGKILADRSLSRLLKKDWPRTLEDLERRSASES